jgi:hypothetical protein
MAIKYRLLVIDTYDDKVTFLTPTLYWNRSSEEFIELFYSKKPFYSEMKSEMRTIRSRKGSFYRLIIPKLLDSGWEPFGFAIEKDIFHAHAFRKAIEVEEIK